MLARLLRLSLSVPFVITSSHTMDEDDDGRFRMLAYRLTERLTDLTTNVSHGAVENFIRMKAASPNRILTVHNGIDTAAFAFTAEGRARTRAELGLREDDVALLSVGRICMQKDHANLISAFELLRREHLAQLFIVGDGPLRADMEAEVRRRKLGAVSFLGARRDIVHLMSACDVFVLSSAIESFGLVVAEAMACERVVVATDSGGVREVLGGEGVLVPPRDPAALAAGIASALALSAQERRDLGARARQRVARLYSIDAAIAQWLEIYRSAAEREACH